MNPDERLIAAFLILECEPGSSPEEVKASYRQLVKVWHPDRFQSDDKLRIKATEKMKAINDAYRLLEPLFEEVERLNCSNEAPATQDSPCSQDARSNAEHRSSTFEIGSETTFVIEKNNPKTGTKVFEQRTEKITGYDGRWAKKAATIITTRPVDLNVSFECAAANSISFLPPDKQGAPAAKIRSSGTLEGLKRDFAPKRREHESENGSGVAFSDESSIQKITIHTDTWFHNHERKATSGRNSSKLFELQEAYEIYELKGDWHSCFEIAQRTIELHTHEIWGWLKRSEALRRAGLEDHAYKMLIPAVDIFMNNAEIPYSLACYAARLGNLQSAKSYLQKTFDVAVLQGPHSSCFEQYQELAMRESDLTPIRNNIPKKPLSWSLRKFFGV